MKKEARSQALKMFLKAEGKITNREIANMVSVNPLTVGRWKRDDNWLEKLKEQEAAAARGTGKAAIRKKAALEQAIQIYTQARGNITNKDLALQVGVSPATISKWKEAEDWTKQLEEIEVQPVETEEAVEVEAREETDLDMGELAFPEHIIQINRKIDALLQREHLTASEVSDLASAKNNLLESVEIYLAILREVQDMKAGD